MSELLGVKTTQIDSDISVSSGGLSSDISVNLVGICSGIWVGFLRTSRSVTERLFGHLGQFRVGKFGHLGQFWRPEFGHLGQKKSENDVHNANHAASLMMFNLLINQILYQSGEIINQASGPRRRTLPPILGES
ncbi:hypothetical protein IHN63_02515 [Deinococcus sp. 6YEL10]|uniref:hypothetical protein n=1 Tax=Deinococcus sp. 6YEL10 TaxID=2745870 RepID=UPI001E32973C|nr:hypothetical protein [Deinococcus sp. 6YEL10]MCD0160173.1 hypothetical protein [Deinococcus sp. 6YEL10]